MPTELQSLPQTYQIDQAVGHNDSACKFGLKYILPLVVFNNRIGHHYLTRNVTTLGLYFPYATGDVVWYNLIRERCLTQ